ncbi:MAG TPA: ABC transporter ATP-binding protein [Paenalcaligenes sp.]|nr:ABC transporter ATP-binding protein [Paenalcaligenes sp.]
MQQEKHNTHPQQNSLFLKFQNVKKTYDQKNLVVKDFNLDVQQGEFVTLLGPSGSGKTTVLMMLAGFEHITSGHILLQDKPIEQIAPFERNIGVVFQNYALFPHLSVADNLAYPLKVRRLPRAEIRERVQRFLNLIELGEFGDRRPAQLSGGQRQRVALARALIFEPSLVLMDEPLGALDKNLREQMQFEITRLHERLGFTVIYVTHDQAEALTMSDRIAVFNHGVVQQYDQPHILYERPSNAFVASFIGENNLIPIHDLQRSGEYIQARLNSQQQLRAQNGNCNHDTLAQGILSVRPEKVQINPMQKTDNEIRAKFITHHYVGDFIRYYFALADGTQITAKSLSTLAPEQLKEGVEFSLGWNANDCFAFLPKDE